MWMVTIDKGEVGASWFNYLSDRITLLELGVNVKKTNATNYPIKEELIWGVLHAHPKTKVVEEICCIHY
jgi:hypothetical protein